MRWIGRPENRNIARELIYRRRSFGKTEQRHAREKNRLRTESTESDRPYRRRYRHRKKKNFIFFSFFLFEYLDVRTIFTERRLLIIWKFTVKSIFGAVKLIRESHWTRHRPSSSATTVGIRNRFEARHSITTNTTRTSRTLSRHNRIRARYGLVFRSIGPNGLWKSSRTTFSCHVAKSLTAQQISYYW